MHIWSPRVTSLHRRCSNSQAAVWPLLPTAICYLTCCLSCQPIDILQSKQWCNMPMPLLCAVS